MPPYAQHEAEVPAAAAAAAGYVIRKLPAGWIIEKRAGPHFENTPVAGFGTLVEALAFLDQALARYEPPASA
jgi:hypothetical protein